MFLPFEPFTRSSTCNNVAEIEQLKSALVKLEYTVYKMKIGGKFFAVRLLSAF